MENGPKLGVPEVVLACPRLNMLHIMSPKNADVSLLPATTWPTITTLSLTYATTDITCNQIIEIWKRFPSLKKLDLSPGTSIQSALVVCDYCPTMKGLYISVDDLRIYLTYSDVGTCSEDPGITKLIIRTEDAGGKRCRDTSSIIRRHRNTLEHLEWDMDIRNDTENIAHIQLPRRTKLRLDTPVWQMIRNAPMLEELMLSSMIIINQPHVLDTIPPRLKSLDLRILGCLFGDHKSSLLRYLNRIALQHQLKHLAIHFSITDNDANILDAIYQHRHLECLKVILTNDWDSYRMARFVDGLVRSCTRLSHLQVLCNYPPSTNSMNLLKRLSRLNQFTFPVCGTGEDDSFWNAIRTFPQLKCITLYGPLDAEYARMKHLKQQRPDMKISKW